MRLLFDENLSPLLATRLADLFPESVHVRDLGLSGRPDAEVWRVAGEVGLVIISKDDDFHHLSFLRGAPPKVVGLRLGNCTTGEIERLLREREKDLRDFYADGDAGFIALP